VPAIDRRRMTNPHMLDDGPAPRDGWRPTAALFRSCATAGVATAIAVIWRRPDLLVLTVPFAVVAAWSLVARPTRPVTFEDHLTTSVVREGEATTWRGAIEAGPELDAVTAVLDDGAWFDRRPASGVVTEAVSGGRATLELGVRSTRWGVRPVERVVVAATTPWAGYLWTHRTALHPLTTLPLPAAFDVNSSTRPTDGLVGQHHSTRTGEGNEFAAIRRYQPGDRMRRINWPRSQRTGELQVNSTWADLDLHLALVVDGSDDFGTSDGIDGKSSSLDLTVRAAGAIAEHYAPRGERVSLRVFGTSLAVAVPPATGQRQLRRILDRLARLRTIERGRSGASISARDPHVASGGQLTVMLSPLIATEALDHAVSLGRAGLPVVVVDTLPDHIVFDEDPHTVMAWRIRLLERRRELRAVRASGIPVIEWRGPGSLDQVIRDIGRRARAPKLAAR
jgi:uncharacterized protein (DUF58 family)